MMKPASPTRLAMNALFAALAALCRGGAGGVDAGPGDVALPTAILPRAVPGDGGLVLGLLVLRLRFGRRSGGFVLAVVGQELEEADQAEEEGERHGPGGDVGRP